MTTLIARGLTDVRSMREILWPAFCDHEHRAIDLSYGQEVDMPRLRLALADPSQPDRPEVVIVANPAPFAEAGLLAQLEETWAHAPAAWRDRRNRWNTVYIQPIVAIFNALYRTPPSSWQSLAELELRSRLVFEAPVRMLTTGPALAELRYALGEPEWADLLGRLATLDVHQVADNERAVLEVATGSRWAGLANWNVAKRVRAGSPVRHTFLDPTPCVPAFVGVVEGAERSELGRQFARWLGSDGGQRAIARTGRLPAASLDDPSAAPASSIPPDVRLSAGNADWILDPDPWVKRFAAIFPPLDTEIEAGKLAV